jgi:hypothetical protein
MVEKYFFAFVIEITIDNFISLFSKVWIIDENTDIVVKKVILLESQNNYWDQNYCREICLEKRDNFLGTEFVNV